MRVGISHLKRLGLSVETGIDETTGEERIYIRLREASGDFVAWCRTITRKTPSGPKVIVSIEFLQHDALSADQFVALLRFISTNNARVLTESKLKTAGRRR